MAAIDIDGEIINSANIMSARIDTRYYVNGTENSLIVVLDDGRRIEHKDGFGFDAFATLELIRKALDQQ